MENIFFQFNIATPLTQKSCLNFFFLKKRIHLAGSFFFSLACVDSGRIGLNQQQPGSLYMYIESLREPEVTRSRYIHGVVSDEML